MNEPKDRLTACLTYDFSSRRGRFKRIFRDEATEGNVRRVGKRYGGPKIFVLTHKTKAGGQYA